MHVPPEGPLPTTRRPRTRQCVYCLGEFPRAQMTDDHVIGRAWYPDTTPATVKRLTAPACKNCNNNRYAAMERYALVRLAMCIDTTDPAAAGIYGKAMRSIDPAAAKGDKDKRHRKQQREAFMRDLLPIDGVSKGVLPFSARNFEAGSRTGLKIGAQQLDSLIEKWVRGFYFCIHGRPMSKSGKVQVFHVADNRALEAFERIWNLARVIDGGAGVQVRCWSAQDSERREEIYAFFIWNFVRIYAGVSEALPDATEPRDKPAT